MSEDKFIVWAEAEGHDRPLLITGLSLARLFDDIVVPYQTGETFFLDGAPVKVKDLKRIKILRAKPHLEDALQMFRMGLTRGETPTRKIYGDQYYVRYEAILRDHSEDVTAQLFIEAMKTLGGT
jgi:hypothetical protein